MYNSVERQSISEKRTLSTRNGLICTSPRDENSNFDFKSSRNDRRKKLLSKCEHLLRDSSSNGNRKPSRECDKSSTLVKNANDIDFSKYWVSGEQFFRTPPKNFNESDECNNKENSATFVQLFGNDDDNDIFRGCRRVSFDHSKLDDTFIIPTQENNDVNKLDMLKDVETSSGRDEDFLQRFELPFYRPELENDNKITNKLVLSKFLRKEEDSKETLDWIIDLEKARKKRSSNNFVNHKLKQNSLRNSLLDSNCAIDTNDFNETNQTSPNKDFRKSNVTEDIQSCCFESLKKGYCKDAVINIRKTNSQSKLSSWMVENISDLDIAKESSLNLTNSTHFIPNTINVYNNYIYLSSEHLKKFFDITKLTKLLRRGARVSHIRRRTFKRADYRRKIHLVTSRQRNHSRKNVCEILAGIKKELSLITRKKSREILPNSIHSISTSKVEETLNELITRCKDYICNNNYREEATTKINGLLRKNINNLQKVLKEERLSLSKKSLKKSMEEQDSTFLELKSIKEKEDFQKMRTSKDDDKQKLLSTGKKIIDRRDKVKGLLNDMLLLTDDISVIEDNKENIKKHNIHHQKTSWDNMKRRPSNNRMESTKNRGQNIKLSMIKKENQMENEINVVSKSRMNPSSNVGKNKMINSKKDKTLREKQNCSEKPIVCQYKLLENSNRTKKSTDTISNISFGNKKEKIKNNVGPRLETIQIIKEKKTRRVSPSIYPACRHLDRTKKHNDIRLNRQVNVQPVWKPAGAVKPFVSNPTFLSNEPINSRSQMLFNKDNQIIRRSIANPSEPTVLKRKHFCKDNQRNENLVEERVNDLCELFAKTQISSKGLKSNRNSSNIFLTSVRGKSRELNLTKDKSEPKSRPRISSLTSRNTSQIVFKNERDGKLPMTSNSSTNIPTNIFIKDYEKNEEVKDQILDGLERNDKRKSLMHLLKVPDEFPAIRSSTYQNQETVQSTKKEMKEESSKEKLHSSNEEIIKIDDSNYLLKSVLKSYENLDHHTPIENQSSLTSSTNNSYKTDLSSVSNLMTAVASSKCQVSSLSSSKSKTNMIFNQSIKPNQSAEIDKDSFETLMDNNREENELEELIELNDRFKQDSDVIDNNEKDKTSPNLVSNVLYSSKTNDIEKNPLNKLPIDTSLNNNNDTETKSMNLTIIEKLRSNDNESIDHMIDEKKSKISQTISDLRSCCDAFTYIDDVKSNYSEQFYKTIISSSPNKIDLNVSLKDVATKVLSQDQSILLPIQMISILTNEHSYKVMKNNATNLNINLINNCDETDTIVNVESKSIGTSDEEKLNHNDRWVRETVELYCEQPNDNLSKTVDKDQKENTDLPNDRWVEETVELYCEQPNDENECKEDKIKLNKSYELLAKINNGNDNIERSTLSESLTNQLNGIKEQLQSVDIQLNKLQATAIQANDIFYRIGKTTTPYDSNFKDMTVSSNDLSKSSNEKQVKNDDRSYEDLHKSIIEASLSSCHSSKRSSKISEEDFQLLNTDLNKMSDNVDTLQTTSRYSTYFYETVRISEDNSNDNQSKECKERFSTKSNSLSKDSLEKFVEKGESIERDKRLSCEYFNENCNHFYNNLNDFNDKVEDTLDMKIKSFSIENIFCESKPTDYSLSNDESDETNSFVFVSIRNSNNTEEKKVKIISEESQHSIFFNTNNSTRTSQSSALNIRNQDLKIIKYYKKEISSPNLQNEEEECNDFYDLAITREGLLLLIYFTVCSFVYFCLNFSITCETFMK